MSDLIIFAGTADGRILAEHLADSGLNIHVCVATEYGGSLVKRKNITVSSERLGDDGMLRLFKENGAKIVIDATHPYAVIISKKIRDMCLKTGLEYMRLQRPDGSELYGSVTIVPDIDSAVEFLKDKDGNILTTTGSKELSKFTSLDGYQERVFARVLSLPEVVEQCASIGFKGRNLICMQGPFNEDINYGMMKQFNIRYMVTKDSGEPGGFYEKIKAAQRASVDVIMVGRPPEKDGMTYGEVMNELSGRFDIGAQTDPKDQVRRNVWVIGSGMGTPDGMTSESLNACRNADIIIGPKRMTDPLGNGNVYNEYRPEPVISFIRKHPEFRDVAVVFSGDIGFYSGAKKFIENADPDWNIIPMCGISSVVYMCSKLMIPWEDVHLMSVHGDDSNLIGEVRRRRKVFSLLRSGEDIITLCNKIIEYGMDGITIAVGERLGYPEERIIRGTPDKIKKMEFDKLSVIMTFNEHPDLTEPIGIADEEFIRGDVPMTKSEVRTLTVSKLKLAEDSVIYDIGAGTGSVSVEMARVAVQGKVFAIESEKEGIDLIKKNRIRFGTDNLEIIEGRAPEAMTDLPVPTHAFIGGSGGSLMSIMRMLKEKNPSIRIVINSVSMETSYEALRCIKELGMNEIETVCVSVSRARMVGGYHLMTAQNPIYMTVCEGPE